MKYLLLKSINKLKIWVTIFENGSKDSNQILNVNCCFWRSEASVKTITNSCIPAKYSRAAVYHWGFFCRGFNCLKNAMCLPSKDFADSKSRNLEAINQSINQKLKASCFEHCLLWIKTKRRFRIFDQWPWNILHQALSKNRKYQLFSRYCSHHNLGRTLDILISYHKYRRLQS